LLADDLVVLTVGSDPDPRNAVFDIGAEGSVMSANPHRPKISEALEMEGGVFGVGLE